MGGNQMKQAPAIVVILEDNPARVEIMRGVVAKLPGNFELCHFDSVGALRVADLRHVRLISLDFSLDSSSVQRPGTGMDAVEFLIRQHDPICPVIVHTLSTADSRRMAEALKEKGWAVRQVNFGTRDRAELWWTAAMELMGMMDAQA